MISEVYMPKNGMDMTEGTLVRWLKNIGESVEKDEPIMEIETDKVTMEAESPVSGVLLKKLYEDGAVVPVLTVLGYIGEAGDKVDSLEGSVTVEKNSAEMDTTAAPKNEQGKPPLTHLYNKAVAATPYAKNLAKKYEIDLNDVPMDEIHSYLRGIDVEKAAYQQVKVTPVAKIAAEKLNVDLSGVKGSGYHGKIMKDDVLNAAMQKTAEKEAVSRGERTADSGMAMNAMRKTISRRMLASHIEIPPVTTCVKVDVTELLKMREKINEGREKAEKVSVNDLVVMATCKALKKNVRFRMSIVNDYYVMHDEINIGIAVGLDDGLVVPILHDVDKKTISQIAKETKELAKKARSGELRASDMGNGCITISNLGMFGTYCFTPIINQPEASIIGVCSIEDELALENGQVTVRKKTILCTTYDHRVINGVEASKFQADLKAFLENPVQIIV